MSREQAEFRRAQNTMLRYDEGHPILDSIADGVFTVDSSWRITSFNRAAEEITGMKREEAIGQTCRDVFKANICHSDCALARSLQTGQRLVNVPVEIHNTQGTTVPISISTAILYNHDGQQMGGVETFRDLSAITELRKQIGEQAELEAIVGRHPRMLELLEVLPIVARSDSTVLIQGASGTGKGLVARTMHNLSPRRGRPFVKVNCAALPETLLESELFGYVKGAFTDARRDKPGRIAVADGGTLFLDEIGDVPLSFQVKLLRIVQEREYEPLGSSETKHADVRVIAATNRNLDQLMQQGLFREDLFYRLNIVNVRIPTLAERREDIPSLIENVRERIALRMGKAVHAVSDEAMRLLMQHDYPGNVRELENAIEHALVLCQENVVQAQHLPMTIRTQRCQAQLVTDAPLQSAEAETIRACLERNQGNRLVVAQELGLHRTTLWRKMRRYSLD